MWKHVLLLVLTICTTTFVGASYYASFASDFGRRAVSFNAALLLQGLWYSVPVLLILGAHEMGHYLCCRHYNVDASLPYFIPLPMFPTGTLGAVIKIREMFPTRTILFDIGVAGPIAGFVAAAAGAGLGNGAVPGSTRPATSRAAWPSANRFSSDSFRG